VGELEEQNKEGLTKLLGTSLESIWFLEIFSWTTQLFAKGREQTNETDVVEGSREM